MDGKKCYEDLDPVSLTVTIARKPDEKKDDDNKVTTLKPGSARIFTSWFFISGQTDNTTLVY